MVERNLSTDLSPPRPHGSALEPSGTPPPRPARTSGRLLRLPGRWWSAPADDVAEASRDPRIMMVDDEPANVQSLSMVLHRAGYRDVQSTTDPQQALSLFRRFEPDLILLDLHMPGLDGLTLLAQFRAATPPGPHLPILMVTGDSRSAPRRAALAQGASDFLTKPFDPPEVLLRIGNMLEVRSLHLLLQRQNEGLEAKVRARTRDLEESQVDALERLATAAEFRDDDTGRHTQRVAIGAAILAEAAGLDAGRIELVLRAAPLHDVGKIGIPDEILLKRGRLTPAEFEIMKSHTTIGGRILGGGRSALMRMAEQIARSHHERWEGGGYPEGRAGEAIPLEARILAIADFFDALTHARPYRTAWPLERVRTEIERLRGTHFDPALAGIFLALECSQRICE